MSAAIYTCEAQISIYNDDTQQWGGYTDAKNLLSLSIQNPEPTKVQDMDSRPGDTFGATKESYLISSGSPTLTISTRDIVNRESSPVEMSMLAAAMSASMSALSKAAASDSYFTFTIDQMELNFDTGDRNLVASSSVVHAQSAADGLMSGNVASADATGLTVTDAGWTVDELIGEAVMITSGTGKGQVVAITDNDATTLTVASWGTQPDATSKFAIVEATALAEGTAYTVDALYGTIKPLSGGGLAAGDVVHGFVDSYAITGTRLKGAAKPSITFRVRGKAQDMKSGSKGFITIPKITAYSSENQEFVANAESPEFKTLTLAGDIELETGQTELYTFDDGLVYATS